MMGKIGQLVKPLPLQGRDRGSTPRFPTRGDAQSESYERAVEKRIDNRSFSCASSSSHKQKINLRQNDLSRVPWVFASSRPDVYHSMKDGTPPMPSFFSVGRIAQWTERLASIASHHRGPFGRTNNQMMAGRSNQMVEGSNPSVPVRSENSYTGLGAVRIYPHHPSPAEEVPWCSWPIIRAFGSRSGDSSKPVNPPQVSQPPTRGESS